VDYDFVLADVFTDRPFGGNQLAVFPDATGLSAAAMQALAREFNFSETTFVLPPASPDNTARLRIFTPTMEVPFAGHPTIGTSVVLAAAAVADSTVDSADDSTVDSAASERAAAEPTDEATETADAAGDPPRAADTVPVEQDLRLELGVGLVRVRVRGDRAELTLDRGPEIPDHAPDRRALARALSLREDDVLDCFYASVGLPFCFAHLSSPQAVDRAVIDPAAFRAGIANGWSPDIYLYAGDFAPGGRLHARMFAPADGVAEDPATGSAAAALVGVLATRYPDDSRAHTLTVHQGVLMGRPSRIEARASVAGGAVTSVSVAGRAQLVGRGTISAPAG
jgi:trans-2,3-dihydro-3-hydroxyanthranilate isomerase